MNYKNILSTFLIAYLGFLSINNTSAQGLDFYSRIDDAGDSLSQSLTTRHLQDYDTFRNFGKECRKEIPWLDTQDINEEMLESLSQGNLSKLIEMREKSSESKKGISTEELTLLSECLVKTYNKVKERSKSEQTTLQNTQSIGVFMDGDTKNSDFDIITDIEKINAIIFTVPFKYDGVKNQNHDLLKNFLNGGKPNKLDSFTNQKDSNSQQSTSDDNNKNNNNTSAGFHGDNTMPWANTCTDNSSGNNSSNIGNMVNDSFLKDLHKTLRGGNSIQQTGEDYSNQKIAGNNSQNNHSGESKNKKDFFSKLPCNGIFCITVSAPISTKDALVGGNSYAIESILEKHLKKMEKVAWSDLSAQKMTNNSFQLPFLNVDFKTKISGGSVFMHSLPQVSKNIQEEQTPEKEKFEFDNIVRCGMIQAGLSTNETQNSHSTAGGFQFNNAHNAENAHNAVIPLSPIDKTQLQLGTDCNQFFQDNIRKKHYQRFSTQVNELQAFSDAMSDIIRQIIDKEVRLDNIPTQ